MTTPHVDLPWEDLLPHAYSLAGGSVPGAFDEQLRLIGGAIHEAAGRYSVSMDAIAEQLGHGIPVAETMRGSIDRAARAVVILDGQPDEIEELHPGGGEEVARQEVEEWFYAVWDRELELAAERHGVSADAVTGRLGEQAEDETMRQQIDRAARVAAGDGDADAT